jgi:uncharacterized membrane protein YbhN (UPF0104 family)
VVSSRCCCSVLGNWAMAVEVGIALPVLAAFAVFVVCLVLFVNLGKLTRWMDGLEGRWLAWAVTKLRRLYDSVTAFRREPGALLEVVVLSLLFRLVNVLGLYAISRALHPSSGWRRYCR